jgi:hypothetical protein
MFNWFSNVGTTDTSTVVVGSPLHHNTEHSFNVDDTTKRRVCRDCSTIVTATMNHKDILEILLLLGPYGIGHNEWEQLWYVSREWRKSVEVAFFQWDSLLHIMPYQRASEGQRKMLYAMRSYLSPEHLWYSTLAAREKIPLPKTFIELSCVDMGCHVFCRLFPKPVKALVSLILGDRDVATHQFKSLTDEELLRVGHCMINTLGAACNVDRYLVADILVPMCQKNESLAMMVYFALRARDINVAMTLLNHLPPTTQSEITKSVAWVNAMVNVAKAKESERNMYSHFTGPVRLPMRPHIEVLKILDASVIQKTSSSQPRVIPCQCRIRGRSHVFVKCFMIKNEDVRPDAFVMDFMRLLDLCLKNIESTPYENVTYDILPLSPDSGIVSLIPGARTLYSLYHENGMSLQNWVIENNTNFSIDHIRGRFVRSCAFSTTTSMMLDFADRHLENILMTRQGLLFHVDFSMIMGREPNQVKSMVAGNACRITPQMVDFLGGTNSQYYKTFQKSCGQVYTTARQCILPLYSTMMALVYDQYCTMSELEEFVKYKFCPGEQSSEARIKVEDRVDRESGRVTWGVAVTDYVHHLFAQWKS